MSATVNLVEGGRILHYVFEDPVNFAEINAVEAQAKVWYDNAKGKLHILIDITKLHRLPEGFLRVRGNHELTHRNAGNIAIIGSSVFVKTMAETIFRVSRHQRFRFFEPRQAGEAWTYLRGVIASEDAASVASFVPAGPGKN